ncbi:MAG: GerMN domain-containing protein [Lachnospiraceae bacterium]
MNKMKWCLLLLAVLFVSVGCRKDPAVNADTSVYYLNKDETTIKAVPYEIQGETTDEKINELMEMLSTVPDSVDMKKVLPTGVSLMKYTLDRKQLYLDFSAEYLGLDKATEVIVRAAIVNTMCQLDEVSYIGFLVAGQPLTDSRGNAIGLMNPHTFLDNMGSEENATKITKLNLYYANKSGDALKATSCVLEYNANVSLEKIIVEQLIAGPTEKEYYPTIPKDTKIVSVTTKDGVCYVNLDSGFTAQGYDVLADVTIYSIVNSLTDLTGINSVQILVNGETNLNYKDSISLESTFQKNVEILEKEKKDE